MTVDVVKMLTVPVFRAMDIDAEVDRAARFKIRDDLQIAPMNIE